MKAKIILAIGIITAISGCKSTPPPVQATTVTIPSIGEVATSYLGENLITHGIGYYADVITVGNMSKFTASFKEAKYANVAGTIIFEAKTNSVGVNNGYGTEISRTNLLAYNKADNEVCITQNPWVANPLFMANCFDSGEVSIVKGGEQELVFKNDSLKKHIEYNGKSGDTLKFTYREFTSGGMARDAFRADFTIDLSEGNTMGYKGARFEITEATNSSITYKIIKPFS